MRIHNFDEEGRNNSRHKYSQHIAELKRVSDIQLSFRLLEEMPKHVVLYVKRDVRTA